MSRRKEEPLKSRMPKKGIRRKVDHEYIATSGRMDPKTQNEYREDQVKEKGAE